jgi:hypothetical protein
MILNLEALCGEIEERCSFEVSGISFDGMRVYRCCWGGLIGWSWEGDGDIVGCGVL